MRPYADRMLELMGITARAAGSVRLPLLERRENVTSAALLPITADRGLAGAFNAQILRRAVAPGGELRGGGGGGKRRAGRGRRRPRLGLPGYDGVPAGPGFREGPDHARPPSDAGG